MTPIITLQLLCQVEKLSDRKSMWTLNKNLCFKTAKPKFNKLEQKKKENVKINPRSFSRLTNDN